MYWPIKSSIPSRLTDLTKIFCEFPHEDLKALICKLGDSLFDQPKHLLNAGTVELLNELERDFLEKSILLQRSPVGNKRRKQRSWLII